MAVVVADPPAWRLAMYSAKDSGASAIMFIIGVQDADGVLHVNSVAGDEKAAASGIKRVKIRKSLVRGDGMVAAAEAAHLFVIFIFFSIILRDRSRGSRNSDAFGTRRASAQSSPTTPRPMFCRPIFVAPAA